MQKRLVFIESHQTPPAECSDGAVSYVPAESAAGRARKVCVRERKTMHSIRPLVQAAINRYRENLAADDVDPQFVWKA